MTTLTTTRLSDLAEFLRELTALSAKHDIWLCEYERTAARMDKDGNTIIEIGREERPNGLNPEYVVRID